MLLRVNYTSPAREDQLVLLSKFMMMTFATFQAEFCVPDYIAKQAEVTKTMRAILVDWLVEVQESFELNHETLYTAVKILDLYMSKVVVDKRDLQLVGATACLIACKIDERIPPCLDDFVYVCDDAYTRTQIKAKEREVLECVGFDVGYPLSYRFVRRYGRVSFSFILNFFRFFFNFSNFCPISFFSHFRCFSRPQNFL